MAHFYIHIGMPKTGSTSIQRNFFELRPFLLERGVNYLDLRHHNHNALSSLLSDAPHRHHFNILRGFNTPEKAAAFNDKIRKRLMRGLRTNTSKKFVISAEALSVVDPAGVQQLKEILQPFATSFRIICYVRHPYDFMSSETQQRVKVGQKVLGLAEDGPLPGYRERIEKFIQVFGRESVDVRVLDSTELVNSDLICDFLAAIGESPDLFDGQHVVKVNESICHEAVLLCNSLNKSIRALESGEKNPDRANLQKWLTQINGTRFVLGTELSESAQAQLHADLDWLHAVLGRDVFKLESREESHPRWDADTIDSLARLLNTMAGLIRQQETALHLSDDLLALLNKPNESPKLPRARRDPGFTPAHYSYNLSRAFVALDQPELALKAAQAAIKSNPGNSEYLNWLNSLKNEQ
jgi:hypothetical protein